MSVRCGRVNKHRAQRSRVVSEGRGDGGGPREESVALVSKDEFEPSGRPDGHWHSRRRKEKGRSQDMAKTVEGGQQKGKGGPRPNEEGLIRSPTESTLSFPNAMLLALSCPVGKDFEGAKCELYPKVNEE